MSFEPDKFFIGLMDFFSILLPGALLVFVFMDDVGPAVLGANRYSAMGEGASWAAFCVASYLVGHLIFLLGAWLDELYDWARHFTLNRQISMLARRNKLLPWPARALIWLIFKRERNLAVDRAARVKLLWLGPLRAKDAVNTFQWAKIQLAAECPNALAGVQRFEADSKFFRSFAIVLLILGIVWPFQHLWPIAGVAIAFALLVLSLWRYMEQRLKATNQAYWSVIALAAASGKVMFRPPTPHEDGVTHAGGVVYRFRGGQIQYLLVEAKRDPNKLVLPKGHIEEGEHPSETAVREVREETGVWARVVGYLPDSTYSDGDEVVSVRFALMERVGRGLASDFGRNHKWLSFEAAMRLASHPETRTLLQAADSCKTRT